MAFGTYVLVKPFLCKSKTTESAESKLEIGQAQGELMQKHAHVGHATQACKMDPKSHPGTPSPINICFCLSHVGHATLTEEWTPITSSGQDRFRVDSPYHYMGKQHVKYEQQTLRSDIALVMREYCFCCWAPTLILQGLILLGLPLAQWWGLVALQRSNCNPLSNQDMLMRYVRLSCETWASNAKQMTDALLQTIYTCDI